MTLQICYWGFFWDDASTKLRNSRCGTTLKFMCPLSVDLISALTFSKTTNAPRRPTHPLPPPQKKKDSDLYKVNLNHVRPSHCIADEEENVWRPAS